MKNKNFVIEKKPQDGICNICLNQFDVLSEDHVPPESTGNHGKLEYRYYFNTAGKTQFHEFTDGIRYKTVCHECNGSLSNFDRCIATFYKQSWQVDLNNCDEHSFSIKPNGIIRGVLGHFLSSKSTHNRSVFDDFCIDAWNDITKPLPQTFNFYVKYYPHNDIRVVRDLVLIGRTPAFTSVMKIKPWAFIVTDQEIYDEHVTRWNDYFAYPWHQKKNVSISVSHACPQDEPEGNVEIMKILGLLATESVIGKKLET